MRSYGRTKHIGCDSARCFLHALNSRFPSILECNCHCVSLQVLRPHHVRALQSGCAAAAIACGDGQEPHAGCICSREVTTGFRRANVSTWSRTVTGTDALVQKAAAAARQAQRMRRPEPRLPKAVATRAKLEDSAHQQKVRMPALAVAASSCSPPPADWH